MYPTLFTIGPVPVRAFGVAVLTGFLLGLWHAMAAARRRMADRKPEEPGVITPDHIFDMALVGLFVSIVMSRALYVLLNLPEFRGNPVDVFKVWTGGVSFHGAIAGASLTVWWYCRRHRLPFLPFADLCAPGFMLGHAIGRVGCFLNGCCYGHACDLPWAVRFHAEGQAGALTPPSHPTQIYAALMSLAVFVLLDRMQRRPHRDGEVLLGFLSFYMVTRFVEELFRRYGPGTGFTTGTADIFLWGLTHAQVFSLVALPVLLYLWRRIRRAPGKTAPREAVPL